MSNRCTNIIARRLLVPISFALVIILQSFGQTEGEFGESQIIACPAGDSASSAKQSAKAARRHARTAVDHESEPQQAAAPFDYSLIERKRRQIASQNKRALIGGASRVTQQAAPTSKNLLAAGMDEQGYRSESQADELDSDPVSLPPRKLCTALSAMGAAPMQMQISGASTGMTLGQDNPFLAAQSFSQAVRTRNPARPPSRAAAIIARSGGV